MHAMVLLLARVVGIGVETADMLVQEVLSRNMRDRRAVARYAGLTGSPDESGAKRREKGLARSGNARVRRGMIQLAWRFLMFQKDSALAEWYRQRTANAPSARKTLMAALSSSRSLVSLLRKAAPTPDPKVGSRGASALISISFPLSDSRQEDASSAFCMTRSTFPSSKALHSSKI